MLRLFKRGINTHALSTSLQAKRVADLKEIATGCGVLTSGNKRDLVQRLTTHFTSPTPASSSILSFDLGYRNLAYCHLDANKTVLDWARVDLDLPSFHPSVVAPIVRQFIKDRVMQSLEVADRVLVEKQRNRSNGSYNIPEGIIRVNCVEAILWSGLYEGIDRINRQVNMTPVLRQNINRAWKDEIQQMIDEDPHRLSKLKSLYSQKKLAGAYLVQHWLDTDTVITCSDTLKEMYAAEKKKDDLSDCLVQALTWIY
ncbi:uncharacterized protein ATC70_000795 [Mucor velutinosus]|uniref:SAP domain-containing protein n=1 Tax=Mucor velutinosus TaxID=708070 RepID=A0AAN7DI23_9FUNG|nr:hypothetical protein ATC70_000795 [Mucor velutinosus]